MPNLHRSVLDRHHYLKGGAPGSFWTLQVSPEGVEWLRARGYDVAGANVSVAVAHVEALKTLGWAYSKGLADPGGSGHPLVSLLGALAPARAEPVFGPAAGTGLTAGAIPAHLSVELLPAEGWRLVVRVGSTPPGVLPDGGVRVWTDALAAVSVLVDDGRTAAVPGLTLWPGSAGASVRVAPRTAGYTLRLAEGGPAGLRDAWRPVVVPGIPSGGAVFQDPDRGGSSRLAPGERLARGERYVLLRPARGGHSTPPADLTPTVLGEVDGWTAVLVTIPIASTAAVRLWADAIGHPLREPRWRLDLVAPARVAAGVDAAADGYPVVVGDRALLLALVPPTAWQDFPPGAALRVVRDDGAAALVPIPRDRTLGRRAGERGAARAAESATPADPSTGTRYLVLAAPSAGVYRIEGEDGWARPLVIGVRPGAAAAAGFAPEHRPAEASASLGPASLRLTLGRRAVDGFAGEVAVSAAELFRTDDTDDSAGPDTWPSEVSPGQEDRPLGVPAGWEVVGREALAPLLAVCPVRVELPPGASTQRVSVSLVHSGADRAPDRLRVDGSAADVEAVVRRGLEGWIPGGTTCVAVDAGAGLGRAAMIVAWPSLRPAPSTSPAPSAPGNARLLRWLAAAAPAFATRGRTIRPTRGLAAAQAALTRAAETLSGTPMAATRTPDADAPTPSTHDVARHPGLPTSLRPLVRRALGGSATSASNRTV